MVILTRDEIKLTIANEVKRVIGYAGHVDELNVHMFYAGTIRLTVDGLKMMSQVFTPHQFAISAPLIGKQYIGLSEMEYPYFLNSRKLVLFHGVDATTAVMHGDAAEFLSSMFNNARFWE